MPVVAQLLDVPEELLAAVATATNGSVLARMSAALVLDAGERRLTLCTLTLR